MSRISELQSEVNKIRNQINAVQAENARLESEINAIGNSAYTGNLSLIETANYARAAMEDNRNTIDYSHNQLKKTYNVQLQIKEMYYIFKDVETANKRIRMLTNKLYFDYRNQATVRKIVRGFMDNLDLNMVKDSTIRKSLEKEFLQAPNYWLAYCLLAIMYWKENNKEKTEQCINLAMEKNKKLTSVFFMLFNLKLQRVSPALHWFSTYQECDKIGNDNSTFLMLISTLPSRINDEKIKDEISKVFVEYIKKEFDKDKEDINEKDINTIITNYFIRIAKREKFNYNFIRQYVKDANNIATGLSMAKSNADILKFIEDLNKVHLGEKNIYLSKYLDELIATPSEEEQKIVDEINYNEEIIATMEPLKKLGENEVVNSSTFKKLAEENHKKKMAHDYGKLNTVNEVVNLVYVNKNNDVNSLTKWNLFALTKDYTGKSYGLYRSAYQSLVPKEYQYAINDYSSTSDFKSLDAELKKKNTFIQNKTARLLATVKDKGAILSIVFGGILCAVFLALFILGLIFKADKPGIGILFIVLSVFAAIGGAILLVKGIITKIVLNPRKRKKYKENMEKESARLEEIIKQLFEEVREFFVEYAEADEISTYIYERISKI